MFNKLLNFNNIYILIFYYLNNRNKTTIILRTKNIVFS